MQCYPPARRVHLVRCWPVDLLGVCGAEWREHAGILAASSTQVAGLLHWQAPSHLHAHAHDGHDAVPAPSLRLIS
eukprot:398876-Rhodomonas_salina.1